MAITRIKNSTISNRTPKYNDVLAGLPFRPVIGTASDGGTGTTVSVAFTGNNPAGAGITYTALSSPGSITATGPASPITVSGLTAGTAYTFQVKAGNSLGDSAYSGSSNSVTPVTPTAFESIATVTSAGGVATLEFTSIPGTYQHLQIRGYNLQSQNGTTGTYGFYIGFNSDTGSNYAWHNLAGDGAAATVNAGATQTPGIIGRYTRNSETNKGVAIIDIHDYASTTKNKVVRGFSGCDMNGTGYLYGGTSVLWMNTNAITSIQFTGNGNWKSGSTFALYGIKGA